MTSFPVSYIVGKGKVYGNRIDTIYLDTHLYKIKDIFKQYNVVELGKWLFRAFINKITEILPKEK